MKIVTRFRDRVLLCLPTAFLASALMSAGCSPPPTFRAGGDSSAGSVSLALVVAPGLTLGLATYTITAPGFSRSGTIDFTNSTTISATIGGLPPGNGYLITLAATLSDGATTCTGSAPFAVTAGMITQVSLRFVCQEPPRTGGVQVGGTINICPVIDAISASPGEVTVGSTIALASAAHDTDLAPSALAYLWTATAGTVSAPAAQNPTFACTVAGPATVTLTVTDGDCAASRSVSVACTGAPAQPPIVVINEVESNGGVPGDWVELYNAGGSAADLSGFVFKDNDDTHAYLIPAGTSLAPGGYFLLEEAAFGFGLGAADSARLYDATGTVIVDSYSWTSHATTTYGRCPNGVGDFTTTTMVTKGSANACPGGGSDGGATGGTTGTGGAAGSDGGVTTTFPWPGPNAVVIVDDPGEFSGNLSGLSYDPATANDPAVLWAVQNGPPTLYRLLWNGTSWESTTTGDWIAGKALHYPDGTGTPDSEGVTKAEADSTAVYVSTERDDSANADTISRLSVLRFDTDALGPALSATHEWNLTSDLPVVDANLGLEAITWVPDTFLVASQFLDESTGQPYQPALYPNHGTGIFFVGLEANGTIYGYALDHVGGGFQRVATFPGGQVSVMDLSFDREVGYLWAYCDDTCGNQAAVLQIDGTPGSATLGRFGLSRFFQRPSTLPNVNNEGIAIAPESECVNGFKPFFWTDDSATGGHSLRRDAIPCGRFF
jgi:Lamin Tail Domain